MERVKLGDVAIEKRETWTGSIQGVPIVGLEHLVPGEVTLSSWDSDSDNTFSKMFRKGQVLLGRRRVYLKKAVIAPFDGICSGDITVIEAIPGKISARLLPFVIQNERFFDYAMQGSAGSLSPRVKWEHLKDYEFNLPDYEEQDCLADKLWSALKLRESYQSLLQATDEMVKSRFIEMFRENEYQIVPLGELCKKITDGSHNPPKGIDHSQYLMISSQNVFSDALDLSDVRYLTKEDFENEDKRTSVSQGDILLTIVGTIGRVYLVSGNEGNIALQRSVAVLTPNDRITSRFLMCSFLYDDDFSKEGRGNAQKGVYLKQLSQYTLRLPSIDNQKAFEEIYKQADKSKFELKQAIEKIDKVMRALIQ